jgi:hypothetical protein
MVGCYLRIFIHTMYILNQYFQTVIKDDYILNFQFYYLAQQLNFLSY